MLDKAEMYNFWSVFSRKIIGKRIMWINNDLKFLQFIFYPALGQSPVLKNVFALPVLMLTVCFVQFHKQVISRDIYSLAP